MLKIVVLSLALVLVLPCCGQVEPSATGGPVSLDDTHMMTPPPVSSESYPTSFGSENQSDFLAAGVIFTSAYVDNLMVGDSTSAISDVTYAILPTINLKRKTPRQVQSLVYNSGFTFYQNTSDLNAINQNAEAQYEFHPSAYSTIAIQDSFQQNSNAFNQNNPNAGGGVSGSPQSSSPLLIVPFQKQISNTVSAGVADQFGKNAMVGGAGSYSFLNYSNAGFGEGLYDSDTAGGSGFYSRRLTPNQYLGGIYQFSKTTTHPVSTFTTTYSILGFYTLYLNRAFSFSVVGGPQHYTSGASTLTPSSAWAPSFSGSVGWQTLHTYAAFGYSKSVRGGEGLLGAYHAQSANLAGRWQMTRLWSSGLEANYSTFDSTFKTATTLNQGGHSLSETVSVRRLINGQLSAEVAYSHLHQSYGGVQAISNFPNSNRVYGSILYQFSRPLGR
jgi:hypothetical protein